LAASATKMKTRDIVNIACCITDKAAQIALWHVCVWHWKKITAFINKSVTFLKFGYLTMLSLSILHSVDYGIINEYGAVGGMRADRGNRSTWRNPTPAPPCPPYISRDLTWDRTQAAALGSRRLWHDPWTYQLTRNVTMLTYELHAQLETWWNL
jgi:hypothetical protein